MGNFYLQYSIENNYVNIYILLYNLESLGQGGRELRVFI